ncbi:MAG: TerC family protein [Reyranella sp.]|uniref:TerC family protein n=1 Tax=Reyranella sp. TaxID=1929291 RepID=UPI001AD12A24|nr:TerC family protein [Reyranella sp.]MBN9090758.1 TerC family protein [Reyranella sp.]
MGFELTPAFWSGLLQIIIVNVVLSGDNALVIALACRNLPKKHQKPAILIGSAGAIILRIIFVLIVDQLLKIGYLKLIGGLLLVWIGVKLVQGEEEGGDGVKGEGSMWAAVRTIIIADAVMSLDNAIAIAAAAHGDTTLIVLGLIISIPLIIFGATLIMLLLNRFPIIVVAGGGLLGWIAGEVLATDPAYAEWLAARLPNAKTIFEIGGAVLVVAVGYALQWRAKRREHAEPVDLAEEKASQGKE